MSLLRCHFQSYNSYKREQCEEHWLSLTAAELNLLSSEAESPKNSMPISNVPMAPNPVQMMYAVLTGIALWAKYKNTPLNVMLIIAKEIQAQKRSGWVPESVNPNGHPISKIAAIMRNSQCILIRDCRLILRNWYWLTRVCHQRLPSSINIEFWELNDNPYLAFWRVFFLNLGK